MKIVSHAIIIFSMVAHPDPPDVGVPRALEFRREGIIVLIDWNPSQYNDINIVYDVEGIPQVTIVFTNSSSTKLQVSYNTQYSVRITATLCGHSNASTTVALKFSESSFVSFSVNN